MGRMRQLAEQIEGMIAEGGYVIGARGLERPQSGITIQPNTEYHMGASTSPTHIIVTGVGKDHIEYVQGPDYKRKLRMERWVAEDLIMRGTRMWLKQWANTSYPWAKDAVASARAMLKGGKGKTVDVADFYPIEVTVEPVGIDKNEAWDAAEEYGGVAGVGDNLEIDMKRGGLDKLKKDKRFKVLDVKNR